MSNVLLIQNTKIENSGYLGELLSEDGFDITSVNAKHETIPTKEFSLIVILGAPESANDDLPYLIAEQKLIKNSVNSNIPVLGICLGSQLIAKTFGAKVYQGPKKEIGFYHDLMFSNNSKLFEGFKNPFSVFHWHGDTFDLPIGATRLVLSANYQNQAFRYKSAVGLQFHLEINEQMVNLWLDKTEEKLKQITYIDPQKIRSDINENISIVKSNMELFYNNFKCEFGL
ncbi:MAG: type 1 glutamine amidotransferase [Candidatus Nitrosopumilus limneticus]|nr:GMP synthase [Candidatus Nitrosopumilus limneticus]MDA0668851.1 type 1 glutamine amidotransferase [Thermoproteota archaeon]HJJ21578.1 type 1 glutamine amidotransferase [Nitrosopumilus sp.]MDA0853263.1 type 1 glutamine amidotransferase [Thermoproteota archaeon]MDA1123059.1 type 1 glutamine amidotransferase [Thermoproteota archaeon]